MLIRFILNIFIYSICIAMIAGYGQVRQLTNIPDKSDLENDIILGGVPGDSESKEDLSIGSKESPNIEMEPRLDFHHAFVSSLTVIVVSELGDKTFFIAAIMAMTHSRKTVFMGAMLALTTMHILSAFFGYLITYIPRVYTFYSSAILFLLFGLKMIRDGLKMSADEAKEEMEEVQMELKKREGDTELKEVLVTEDSPVIENHPSYFRRAYLFLRVHFPRVFLEAFSLTFLAEWGDRSQIATVVLAASNDLSGIIIGGLLGHFFCTGLAVLGGKIIASRISVKTVTITGGFVFIGFGVVGFVIGP